jgi:Arc/MetJ-type ribon-helix-helix transcriptional regulator
MPLTVPPDVEALVAQQMSGGRYRTEEDVLRSAMHALLEANEDLAAVQQALEEWRGGDPGVALDDAVRTIRARHSSDARS